MVRVRLELTTLALSAPRSADWANGPSTYYAIETKVELGCFLLQDHIFNVTIFLWKKMSLWQFAKLLKVFHIRDPSHQTLQSRDLRHLRLL